MEQQLPYEVRVLVEALEEYMETDVCICEVQPCPENCDRCTWCIGALALARNGIEAPRKVVGN